MIIILLIESSGGNKRKVSAALAFMANPALVFLDEPTTVRFLILQHTYLKIYRIIIRV
jgi:ABC-type glutathione transport system ATPase component